MKLLVVQNTVHFNIISMKIFTVFLFVLVLSVQAIAQTSQLPVMIGDVKGFTKTTNGISVTLTNARADISVYSPTTIRVRISGAPLGPDQSYAVVAAATGTFTRVRDHRDSLMLETDSLRVVIQKKPFRVKFCKPDGTILLEDYPAFGTSWLGTEVTSYKKLFPDEKFIGLGEKTGPLNSVEMPTRTGIQTFPPTVSTRIRYTSPSPFTWGFMARSYTGYSLITPTGPGSISGHPPMMLSPSSQL